MEGFSNATKGGTNGKNMEEHISVEKQIKELTLEKKQAPMTDSIKTPLMMHVSQNLLIFSSTSCIQSFKEFLHEFEKIQVLHYFFFLVLLHPITFRRIW